jgi:hypothetical protein
MSFNFKAIMHSLAVAVVAGAAKSVGDKITTGSYSGLGSVAIQGAITGGIALLLHPSNTVPADTTPAAPKP